MIIITMFIAMMLISFYITQLPIDDYHHDVYCHDDHIMMHIFIFVYM